MNPYLLRRLQDSHPFASGDALSLYDNSYLSHPSLPSTRALRAMAQYLQLHLPKITLRVTPLFRFLSTPHPACPVVLGCWLDPARLLPAACPASLSAIGWSCDACTKMPHLSLMTHSLRKAQHLPEDLSFASPKAFAPRMAPRMRCGPTSK